MNQPNQPPKSAELYKFCSYCGSRMTDNYCMCNPPRYVTDEEIDAMFPLSDPNEELTFHLLHTNWINTYKSQAAKAMRDMIFNNVKPKV